MGEVGTHEDIDEDGRSYLPVWMVQAERVGCR
jgi:hypothetical protein